MLPKEYSFLSYNHVLENNVAFCVSNNMVLGFVNYESRSEGLVVFYVSAKISLEKTFIKQYGKSIGESLITTCLLKHKKKTVLFSSTTSKAKSAIKRTRSQKTIRFKNTTRPLPKSRLK